MTYLLGATFCTLLLAYKTRKGEEAINDKNF